MYIVIWHDLFLFFIFYIEEVNICHFLISYECLEYSARVWYSINAFKRFSSMNGENWLLVTDEAVEFEKNMLKFKTLG